MSGPHVLSVGIILNATFATNKLRTFALAVLLDVTAASYALVLVAFLLGLLLHHTDLFANGVMELSRFQRVCGDDLNLTQILTALRNEILSLNDALVLCNDCHRVAMRIILIVRSLMLIQQRQM